MRIHRFHISECNRLGGISVDVGYQKITTREIDLRAIEEWASCLVENVISGKLTNEDLIAESVRLRAVTTDLFVICDSFPGGFRRVC